MSNLSFIEHDEANHESRRQLAALREGRKHVRDITFSGDLRVLASMLKVAGMDPTLRFLSVDGELLSEAGRRCTRSQMDRMRELITQALE